METVVIIAVVVACLLGWTLVSLVAAFVLGGIIARAKRESRRAARAELKAQEARLTPMSERARSAA